MTPQEAFLQAIKLCGGQIAFAKSLTEALSLRGESRIISQQIVSYWSRSPSGPPIQYCVDIEELPKVNFQITKSQLRPDFFNRTPYTPIEEAA